MTNYRRKQFKKYQESREQFEFQRKKALLACFGLLLIGIWALALIVAFWPK